MAIETPNWEDINFRKGLGPQIGGLLHDAVALTISEKNIGKEGIIAHIEYWLDTLYDIAEQKKEAVLKEKLNEVLETEDKAF